MSKGKKFFIKNKNHIIYISILLVLMLVVHNDTLTSKRFRIGEMDSGSYDQLYFLKKTITEYHEIPLWLPTYQAGTVFFAHPNYLLFFYTTIIALIIPSTVLALNIILLLNIFLAGLFMYILMINLKQKPKIAFVSSLIYMFSIHVAWMFSAYIFRGGVVALAPLVYLFVWKALHDKKWVKYSIIAGLVVALQFHSNGLNWFMFMMVVFITVFGVYLIGKNLKKRLIKAFLVGSIIGVCFLGLAAVRIFPLLEYEKVSSKQGDFSYEDSVGMHFQIKSFKDFFHNFLVVDEPLKKFNWKRNMEIGIFGFILSLIALTQWRKKYVLTLIVLALLSVSIAVGSPVFYLLWKFVPGFSKLHHIMRISYIFLMAVAALAGIGLTTLLSKFRKKYNFSKRKLNYVYAIFLMFILIDTFVLTYYLPSINDDDKYNFQKMLENNHLLQYISKDDDIFRINNIKTNRHSGHAGVYAIQLDEEILYGGTSLWIPELYVFLGITHSLPAKFSGMLNTKYIYSDEPINQSYLTFVEKFEECEICYEHEDVDHGVDGPYLYYNELYLPRAYLVDNGILVIGDKNAVDQTSYALMMNDNFDPSNSVIVMVYGRINDYGVEFLKRFNAIFLTQNSIDQNSGFILQQYVDSGGVLLPNVVEGGNSISQEEIDGLLISFGGDYGNVKKIDITYYSPNKRYMELKGKQGWMVLAEKFHMFEGWEPEINNVKKPIFRANGMNSAVYLEGETGEMRFEYTPSSFRKGAIISGITLLLIVLYFVWGYIKRKSFLSTNKNSS